MTSAPAYLLNSSLIQQSPITDKYYLQLADHTLLDLLKEAVKSILIFNVSCLELPIIQLQKEIYLIYDNRIIKEQDIIDTIKDEIRETAKLQKKFLDMSYTYLEKEKNSLSDMRESDDIWSISWNKYKSKEVDDSFKKSFGVVANLVCNNYHSFTKSIREILSLVDHLYKECLIPLINTDELEESLMEIITHQFFLQYNCLDLHKVLPIIAQPQKEGFVYCSDFGVDLRKKISKYSVEENIYDLLLSPKKNMKSPEQTQLTGYLENEDKNGLKQLMKEMFFKEFRNNEIISPLLFDENGKLKLFDSEHLNNEDDGKEDFEVNVIEKKKELAPVPESKKEAEKIVQKAQKAEKAEKVEKVEKVEKAEKVGKIEKVNTEKKSANSNLVSISKYLGIQKQVSAYHAKKSSKSKESNKTESISASQKVELKQKTQSINEILPDLLLQQEKSKDKNVKKIFEEKTSKELVCQESKNEKSKDAAEKIQISTTKIVLSTGTTLQARVTSLTISATEDADKLNKNINILKEIHTMRKGRSNAEVLEQLTKDYGMMESKSQDHEEDCKEKAEDKEDSNELDKNDANKKKKKKRKNKNNKKGEQVKEEFFRTKSETISAANHKVSPVMKTEYKCYPVSEQEKAVSNYLDGLEIDVKNRIQCKIDEDTLKNWRKRIEALKKSFK